MKADHNTENTNTGDYDTQILGIIKQHRDFFGERTPIPGYISKYTANEIPGKLNDKKTFPGLHCIVG